jgi:hypothetical protein
VAPRHVGTTRAVLRFKCDGLTGMTGDDTVGTQVMASAASVEPGVSTHFGELRLGG